MRWLTIPLRREADVLFARGRLRAWADAVGVAGLERTRVITVGAELVRAAVDTRDGSIEFGWEREVERSFCVIELPSYASVPADLIDAEIARAADGTSNPLQFEVILEGARTRYRFLVDVPVRADDVQRAVAESPDASAIDMLREQNLEMARMLGTLRDREAELVRALDEARHHANEATAHALHLQVIAKKKDEFLAIASHDVRAPIAAAKGALELLEPTLINLNDDQKHLLAVARRAADAVVHLLANLMSTALIERADDDDGPTAPLVDVAVVAREILEVMEVQARHKGLELRLEVDSDATTVRGDLMWIRQVISNVVNNALKFTPKGGHVRVNIGRKATAVILAVEDDGVGVPPDKADRVFEKLTKLRPRGTAGERGTGIGLYVTKQLVDRLGGTISLSSREPAGTRFEVCIPYVEGVAAPMFDSTPI